MLPSLHVRSYVRLSVLPNLYVRSYVRSYVLPNLYGRLYVLPNLYVKKKKKKLSTTYKFGSTYEHPYKFGSTYERTYERTYEFRSTDERTCDLGAHRSAQTSAHTSFGAHTSAHMNLGEHTSAHTSACMCAFLPRDPTSLIVRPYADNSEFSYTNTLSYQRYRQHRDWPQSAEQRKGEAHNKSCRHPKGFNMHHRQVRHHTHGSQN